MLYLWEQGNTAVQAGFVTTDIETEDTFTNQEMPRVDNRCQAYKNLKDNYTLPPSELCQIYCVDINQC